MSVRRNAASLGLFYICITLENADFENIEHTSTKGLNEVMSQEVNVKRFSFYLGFKRPLRCSQARSNSRETRLVVRSGQGRETSAHSSLPRWSHGAADITHGPETGPDPRLCYARKQTAPLCPTHAAPPMATPTRLAATAAAAESRGPK